MKRKNKKFNDKQKVNQHLFVIIPFCKSPYNLPIRYQRQWWVRKSFYNIVPWNERTNKERNCTRGLFVDGNDLVVIKKEDMKKHEHQHILYEFSHRV